MNFGLERGCLRRRLILVIFVQGAQFQCRLFRLVRSCRFIGALIRSLCLLPGGLRRFAPCSTGANHCRLRHIGWENCGLGKVPLRYPPGSGRALLAGTLPLSFCAARFAYCTQTWLLPVSGYVDRLIASHSGAGDCRGKVVRVHPVSNSEPARKRFRLNRKTPAHLAGFLTHSRPRVWKRLRQDVFSCTFMRDHTRRRCDQAFGVQHLYITGLGWCKSPGQCASPRLHVCTPF